MSQLNDQFTSWFWGNSDGCFRAIWSSPKDNVDTIKLDGSFQHVKSELQTYNDAGYGVFFVPNQGGHSDGDINRFNSFFLDLDAEKGQTLPDTWHVEPTVITKRGDNYHVYWLLNPSTNPVVWRNIQERLVNFYNADKAVKNPSRVMRLPGFLHTKKGVTGDGYEVFATFQNRYAIDALSVGLPEIPTVEIDNTPRKPRDPSNYYESLEYGVKCLEYISADVEYQDWLNVIAAFSYEYGAGEDVVVALDDWSKRSEHKYTGTNEIIKKINSFNRGDTGGVIVKFGTVVDMAKTGGMVPREIMNTDKRDSALALMASTFDPNSVTNVAVVKDKYASKEAIDLAWQVKNAMERICKNIPRAGSPDEKPFEITVNPDVVEKIITRSQWMSNQSKVNVLSDENTFNTYAEKDMFNLLKKHFGQVWISDDVDIICKIVNAEKVFDITPEKLSKQLIATGTGEIVDYLKMMNQRTRMNIKIDMFADRPRMIWEPEIVTVVMTWKPIAVTKQLPNPDVIADYKSHFEHLDDVLDQIIASRFSSDRKNFFVWMHCESDWGKGLFTSLLRELGICVELSVTECEKAFDGDPLGRTSSEFIRAFVVLFDEFKNVKKELKQLENSIPITPKNQMKQDVEVFTKLFTSAEMVDSLAGSNGVEDQFANRFSYLNCKGSIKNRPMFNGVGRKVYACAVRDYIGQYMNTEVDKYIALGEVEATRKADSFGDDFQGRRGIDKAFDRLSSSVSDLTEEFKKWCIANHQNGFGGAMGNCIREGDFYYLKASAKMFNDWIDETMAYKDKVTFSYKKEEVIREMSHDGEGVKARRVSGKLIRSVQFKLKDDQ